MNGSLLGGSRSFSGVCNVDGGRGGVGKGQNGPEGRRIPVALGIGSNVGDRLANLRFAVAHVRQLLDPCTLSGVYETMPLHERNQPDFLNACATGRTRLSARQLLSELQHIERLAGRTRGRRYGPRTLDLDLLLYGDRVIEQPNLIVPHPRMHERGFVLEPLREIAGDWVVPGARSGRDGVNVDELADALSTEGVARTKLRLEDG